MEKEIAKELDYVLGFFKNNKDSTGMTYLGMDKSKYLTENLSHPSGNYVLKLIEDGLIKHGGTEIHGEKEKFYGYYNITFKGIVFEGYEKTREKKSFTDFLSKTEIWIIAIGTGLAGLYSLIQICQWIYCKCCCQI